MAKPCPTAMVPVFVDPRRYAAQGTVRLLARQFARFIGDSIGIVSMLLCPVALAAPPGTTYSLLSLPQVSAVSLGLPGSFKTTQLLTEQTLPLSSQLGWETSTGLTTTQYTQLMPFRAQSALLTTGPRLQLDRFDLSVPMQSGYELGTGQDDILWTSSTPRISFAPSPNDRISLEARIHHRTERRQTSLRKSRKSIGVNLRHSFNDKYSLKTGIVRRQEILDDGLQRSRGAELFAQVNVTLPDQWQVNLLGSVQRIQHPSYSLMGNTIREQSATLTLSASRALAGGWSVTGSYSIDQNGYAGLRMPVFTQSGRLRLTRDF